MGAPQPQTEARDAETAGAAPAQQGEAAWLDRIVDMAGGRDDLAFTFAAPQLGALLADPPPRPAEAAPAPAPFTIALDSIRAPRDRARQSLNHESIAALAASLSERGLLQPLLVRPLAGAYELVAGSRRFHAAKLAGLSEVPVVVRELSDRDALMVAVVENLQREDLPALDEAQSYFRLLDEFGWTQEEVAERVGRSRAHVGNTLRLLGLPPSVKMLLEEGRLTAGHARALLGAPNPSELAALVVARGLSVRQTEALVQQQTPVTRRRKATLDTAAQALEQRLGERLGLPVRLQATRRGGKLIVQYRSLDDLEAALQRYASPPAIPANDDGEGAAAASVGDNIVPLIRPEDGAA
jgi:ParB family chromosome partitioning protein